MLISTTHSSVRSLRRDPLLKSIKWWQDTQKTAKKGPRLACITEGVSVGSGNCQIDGPDGGFTWANGGHSSAQGMVLHDGCDADSRKVVLRRVGTYKIRAPEEVFLGAGQITDNFKKTMRIIHRTTVFSTTNEQKRMGKVHSAEGHQTS